MRSAHPNPCWPSSSSSSTWPNSKPLLVIRSRRRDLYSTYAAAAVSSTFPLRKLDLVAGFVPSQTMSIRHAVSSGACVRSEQRTVCSSSVLGCSGEGLVVIMMLSKAPKS